PRLPYCTMYLLVGGLRSHPSLRLPGASRWSRRGLGSRSARGPRPRDGAVVDLAHGPRDGAVVDLAHGPRDGAVVGLAHWPRDGAVVGLAHGPRATGHGPRATGPVVDMP
ncbi:MAG: hypothetical protein M0Z82_11635, partial [Actinomycetota bacterium]|nr:hypothetical protein [Actinomycetota bacterium]